MGNRVVFEIILLIMCLVCLVIGLSAGGIEQKQNAQMEQRMAETLQALEAHPYSAVLVDVEIAKLVGFEPRDFDCVIKGGY